MSYTHTPYTHLIETKELPKGPNTAGGLYFFAVADGFFDYFYICLLYTSRCV